MIKSLLTEYGLPWFVNRSLYTLKLKMMTIIPATEMIFEKKVDVKQIDIFNLNVAGIKHFLENLSSEKQDLVISTADKAIKGIIVGFSSIELNYGNPINWHYNPLTGAESSQSDKWYHIPDFDVERGDIKVIWEASRFTHFIYLARAYLITGNEKYYKAFSEQLAHWIECNPYSFGANYKCGQECALRMINALIAYTVFTSCKLTTAEDEKNIKLLVEVCYKKILSNFFYAHKCIKNNHTLSEICGLIIGAWCCKDEVKLKKAYKLLDREIRSQFLPDGGYVQYSFNYQRFALQLMECVFKLSERTNYEISQVSRQLIKNSTILLYQTQEENGDMPNYGSNDGALIFPVTVCSYRDFRPVINTVYACLEGLVLFHKGDYDEELLWFGNGKEVPKADIERRSYAFTKAGLYTIRDATSFIMICLQDFKTRPAHMDQLHIDLWYKGKNIFCDSGTYSYVLDEGKELVLTAAHNTVKVGNLEQMDKRGAFFIYNWTQCKDITYDESSFSGTMISKNGYKHTRTISKTSKGYAISDEVTGNAGNCRLLFHTPYEVNLVAGGFEVLDDEEKLCIVRLESPNIEVKKVYRSLYYHKKEEISCIAVSIEKNESCIIKYEIELNY